MNPKTLETELKLEIEAHVWNALNPDQTSTLQQNIFLDTEDFALRKLFWALRIRKENSSWTLTAKGPSQSNEAGTFIRPEIEIVIENELAQSYSTSGLQLSPSTSLDPLKVAIDLIGDKKLLPFLEFKNYRTKIPFYRWTLELDRTEVLSEHFYELEAEAPSSQFPELMEKLRTLFDSNSWSFQLGKRSKFEKALEIHSRQT